MPAMKPSRVELFRATLRPRVAYVDGAWRLWPARSAWAAHSFRTLGEAIDGEPGLPRREWIAHMRPDWLRYGGDLGVLHKDYQRWLAARGWSA